MRFLDANIFIYAYYKPKKHLTEKEKQMKKQSQEILSSISQGKENVITTVVHLSEIANILKHGLPQTQLITLIRGLYMLDNLTIKGITAEEYFSAAELGEDLNLEPNDALAVDTMRQTGTTGIYTFDEHFNKIEGITPITKIQP